MPDNNLRSTNIHSHLGAQPHAVTRNQTRLHSTTQPFEIGKHVTEHDGRTTKEQWYRPTSAPVVARHRRRLGATAPVSLDIGTGCWEVTHKPGEHGQNHVMDKVRAATAAAAATDLH